MRVSGLRFRGYGLGCRVSGLRLKNREGCIFRV